MRHRDRAALVLWCIGMVVFCGAVLVSAVRSTGARLPSPFCTAAISLFSNIHSDYFSAEFAEMVVSKPEIVIMWEDVQISNLAIDIERLFKRSQFSSLSNRHNYSEKLRMIGQPNPRRFAFVGFLKNGLLVRQLVSPAVF